MLGTQGAGTKSEISPGISVRNLRMETPSGRILLDDLSFSAARGSFMAVVGPSGCGKSTLIRTLAGLLKPTRGTVNFSGHSVGDLKSQFPLAMGYIPQFGTFHSSLTIREILHFAAALRLPRHIPAETRRTWLEHVTALAGLGELLDQRFSTLSGGQARRVALAEELVGDPAFLLLDELTTGLDIFSEGEIMRWLRDLAHRYGKTVMLVTHGTQHLDICDSIAVLNAGQLTYVGKPAGLFGAQQVDSMEELFGRFSAKHPLPPPAKLEEQEEASRPEPLQTDRPPNGLQQVFPLVHRQALLLWRDPGQIFIHLALIFTFPALVAIFALNGLPEVRSLAEPANTIIRTLEDRFYYFKNSVETASLISGLVMFQVVLLTLIGANNGAREIAREREILRKELFAGLSPPACLTSKFLQMAAFSLVQSFWMAWFVKSVCGFPGNFTSQLSILFFTTLAMSVVCLAISAVSPTPERASLLSIYLVGFQLPLSGAALALPGWLAETCRPFIAAYWGWSGFLRTLDTTRYFRLVSDTTKTQIASFDVSILVLAIHIALGLLAAGYFLNRLRQSEK